MNRLGGTARAAGTSGGATRAVIFSCLVAALAACGPGGAPEYRARDFIEALVREPENTQKLQTLARPPAGQAPQKLVQGVSAGVALDFLRARRAQGADLMFTLGEVQRPDRQRRIVAVAVSHSEPTEIPGARTAARREIVFKVKIEGNEQWRITRVWAEE